VAKPKFDVRLTPAAEREYGRIDQQFHKQIDEAIATLESNARPYNSESLTGNDGYFRLRSGGYRIIYSIDYKKGTIVIANIRKRGGAYRGF
jgi:mRNA interferase RelE/StbE